MKRSLLTLFAVLAIASLAGCSTPNRDHGGWQGPLVDPDGAPITPPTYEVQR